MWKNVFSSNDIGLLILRLTVGSLMIIHGIYKLANFDTTIGWISAVVVAHHLPAFFVYGVFIGEIVAPILVILGLFTRIGGLIIVVNMIFTIVLVRHGANVFLTLNGAYGGWTLQPEAFFLLTGLSLIFLGGGKYAINRY